MRRTTVGLCIALVTLAAGCGPDLGLEDNIPADAAAMKEPKPLVVATMRAQPPDRPEPIEFAERRWVPAAQQWGGPVPQSMLSSIGSADGRSLLAARWDTPPYDRVFTRTDDGGLQEFVPLLGVGAPPHDAAVVRQAGNGQAEGEHDGGH